MNRRHVLRSGAAGLCLATTGCSFLAELFSKGDPKPPAAGSARAFDIHCHVFNAEDIPVRSFVEHVVLRGHPVAGVALDPLVTMVALSMTGEAPTPAEELAAIQGGRLLDQAIETDEQLLRRQIERGAERMIALQAQGLVFDERVDSRRVATAQSREEQRRFLEHFAQKGAQLRAEARPAVAVEPTSKLVADGIIASGGDLLGVFWMATLLTRPRLELSQRLARLPAKDGGEIRFFAPAMVDFSYWLADRDLASPNDSSMHVSRFDEQVDVMDAVQSRPGRAYALHGWVPYCPWRQLEEPKQWDRVVDAIEARGFLGVKLYPLMGFYPLGNEQAADGALFPLPLRSVAARRQMDLDLARLYAWCEAKGVPILAHCSHSQYPTEDGSYRGAAENWEPVLAKHRSLRLNIGHFGGIWHLVKGEKDRPVGTPWTNGVTSILNDDKNLYVGGDISDFTSILGRDAQERETARKILAELAPLLPANGQARNRIMYGTDWVMLARSLGADAYYPNMKTIVPKELGLTDAERRSYLGGAAARLTGVALENGAKPQTRLRLETYYAARGLDPQLLAAFDAPGTTA